MLDISRFSPDGVGVLAVKHPEDYYLSTVAHYQNSGGYTFSFDMTPHTEIYMIIVASAEGTTGKILYLDGVSISSGGTLSIGATRKKVKNNGDGTCTVYNSDGTLWRALTNLTLNFSHEQFGTCIIHYFKIS